MNNNFTGTFDTDTQDRMKNESTAFLKRKPPQGARSDQVILRSIFPAATPDMLSMNMYMARFFNTPWHKNPALKHSDLLLSVYAIMATLRGEHAKRDYFSNQSVTLARKSKWLQVRINFVNELVAFLIYSIMQGPLFAPKAAVKVCDQVSRNNPLYFLIAIPIMKMAHGFFPRCYGHSHVLTTDIADFVTNQKNRMGNGLYSNWYCTLKVDGSDDSQCEYLWCKGAFYWHHRALSLVNRTFHEGSKHGKKITTLFLSPAEETKMGYAFAHNPTWMTPPKRVKAVRWFVDGESDDDDAAAALNPYASFQVNDNEDGSN